VIINRNATNVAHIYVREIDVLQADHLEGRTHE
jgi:hypothetical protein